MRNTTSEELNQIEFNGQYQMIANQKNNKIKYISFLFLFLALTANIIYTTRINPQTSTTIRIPTNHQFNPIPKNNKTIVNHITVRQLQNAILLKKTLLSNNLNLSALQDSKSLQKYQLYEIKELPLCIFSVISRKKNVQFFLKSLSAQKYTNFKVLLIDQTGQQNFRVQIQKIIKRFNNLQGKITIKTASKQEGFFNHSFYAAKSFCQQNQILIEYSQKSLILGTHVFKLFNHIFHQNQVWLAYGSALLNNNKVAEYGEYHRDVIDSSTFRKQPYLLGNVIAYAPDLINYIQENDLKNPQGDFYNIQAKKAFYFTLLELAKKKTRFIPQLLQAEIKDHKFENEHSQTQQKLIRERDPVKAIGSLKHQPSY